MLEGINIPLTGAGGVAVVIVGYIGKLIVSNELKRRAEAAVAMEKRLQAHDDHVKKCDGERAVATAKLEAKVDTLAANQYRMEKTLTHIGGGVEKLLSRFGSTETNVVIK